MGKHPLSLRERIWRIMGWLGRPVEEPQTWPDAYVYRVRADDD
jgi:hypothetical protein